MPHPPQTFWLLVRSSAMKSVTITKGVCDQEIPCNRWVCLPLDWRPAVANLQAIASRHDGIYCAYSVEVCEPLPV